MKTADLTSAELISELVTEMVRRNAGAVGVLVRDVPAPDSKRLIERLASLREEEGIELRIAYLLDEEVAEEIDIDTGIFSREVEQAE